MALFWRLSMMVHLQEVMSGDLANVYDHHNKSGIAIPLYLQIYKLLSAYKTICLEIKFHVMLLHVQAIYNFSKSTI